MTSLRRSFCCLPGSLNTCHKDLVDCQLSSEELARQAGRVITQEAGGCQRLLLTEEAEGMAAADAAVPEVLANNFEITENLAEN